MAVKLTRALRQSAGIERSVAQAYAAFAAHWRSDPEVASLWRRMAEAEARHAAVLERAADLAAAADPVEAVDPSAFARLSGHVAALTCPAPPPRNLDEALETALALERLDLDGLHRALISIAAPGLEDAVGVGRMVTGAEHLGPLLVLADRCQAAADLRARINALLIESNESQTASLPPILERILARIRRSLAPR